MLEFGFRGPEQQEKESKVEEKQYIDPVLELHDEVLAAKWEKVDEQMLRDEEIIDESELFDILTAIGLDTEGIRLDAAYTKESENYLMEVYRLSVKGHFSEERLPDGYAYKGGAARVLLERALGLDYTNTPRDLDIIRTDVHEPYEGADDEVSKTFMPEDFEHGHGVEVITDVQNYLASRDFTINEVMATDTEIFVTRQGLLDTARHIIRITEYEREADDNDGVPHQKQLAKAVRMYTEAIVRYGEADRIGVDDWVYERGFIHPFYLALHLDKAYSRSSKIADAFVEELIRLEQIPDDITNAEAAMTYINNLLWRKPFHFRHIPDDVYQLENRWLDSFRDKYEHMPKTSGMKRRTE